MTDEPQIIRKYSVGEIDELRALVISRDVPHPSSYRSWGQDDNTSWSKRVEDRLRTYLMAGVSVDELKAALPIPKNKMWML